MAEQVQNGRYVYAVVPGPLATTFEFPGLNGALVYAISNGKVAAVVSDIPPERVRPERRHLAAQQGVLQGLLKTVPAMLPMSFGIIADSPKVVKNILSRNQTALLQQLQRVANRVEMGLRVVWDVPNIFEYFVHAHPELQEARDRLLGPLGNPTQNDKLELGRLFDRLLREDREFYTGQVEEVLARSCQEIKRNQCRQELEVMNLACLVPRAQEAAFEAAVFTAAQLFDQHFAFDYHGPWPPHNFVDVSIKL
jgi:hypothetical protein